MTRFRLFARPGPGPVRPRRPPGRPPPDAGPAGPWSAQDYPDDREGPATRSARPARRRAVPDTDAPTDPWGMSPVPGAPQVAAWGEPSGAAGPVDGPAASPVPESHEPTPHPAEAAALAAAFAADYLSWDEDDPARRGVVLADYLPDPAADVARLGWSGRGRQRAEIALPGLVRPDGDGRVLVDVRVRVTPYRPVGGHDDRADEPDHEIAGIPAVAPAPAARGWRSLAAYWVRISVPVAVEGERLVVDAGEERPGESGAEDGLRRSERGHGRHHRRVRERCAVTGLRIPVVAGVAGGVGTTTIAVALRGHDGGRAVDAQVDVVVCRCTGESLRRAARFADALSRHDPRPVLAVTADRSVPVRGPLLAQVRTLGQRYGSVVVLPHVGRWREHNDPLAEAVALLARPAEELPRPLRAYATALRRLAADVAATGRLHGQPGRHEAPPRRPLAEPSETRDHRAACDSRPPRGAGPGWPADAAGPRPRRIRLAPPAPLGTPTPF